MNAPIVQYQFTEAELRTRLAELSTATFDTPSAYKEGKQAIAVCRTLRGEIEAKRKELKADALAYGRAVDSVAKRLVDVIEAVELPLKERKAAVDAEKERIKREQEEAERQAREAELRRLQEEEEAKRRAEREAEEKRLADERERLETERRAFEAEQARARAEQEAREQAELEKREAEERAIAEERVKVEAERRAVEEQKRAAEQAEAERQARIRAEQEAAERAEEERIAAEEAAVREAERRAEMTRRLDALRPDKDRALSYLDALLAVECPDIVDEEIGGILVAVAADLAEAKRDVERVGDGREG